MRREDDVGGGGGGGGGGRRWGEEVGGGGGGRRWGEEQIVVEQLICLRTLAESHLLAVQLVYLHLNFKIILNWINNHKFMSFLSSELFTPMNTGHKLFIEVNYCKYFIFFGSLSPNDKISEYKM